MRMRGKGWEQGGVTSAVAILEASLLPKWVYGVKGYHRGVADCAARREAATTWPRSALVFEVAKCTANSRGEFLISSVDVKALLT